MYLPEGVWIDYETRNVYKGKQWIRIRATELPGIVFIKNGSVIPHITLAQSTEFMDWTKIELVVFDVKNEISECRVFVKKKIISVKVKFTDNEWTIDSENNELKFSVRKFDE